MAEVKRELLPGGLLFAFLDDIYVVCSQARVRIVFNLLSVKLFAGAGIRLHAGKTRVWNKAGIHPPTWAIWVLRSGTPRRSIFWAPQSVQMRLCRLLPRTDWKRNGACGRPFHGCRTFSVVEKSSCSALDPVVTTSSGQSLLHNPFGTPKAMTQGCSMPWKLSLEVFQGVQNRRRQRTRSCHFQ